MPTTPVSVAGDPTNPTDAQGGLDPVQERALARAHGLRQERARTLAALGSMTIGALLLTGLSLRPSTSAGGSVLGLAGLVGLLLALNIILAVEREAESGQDGSSGSWWLVLPLTLVLLVAQCALLTDLLRADGREAASTGLRAGILLPVLILCVVGAVLCLKIRRRRGPAGPPLRYVAREAPSDRTLAVACSGGGIRAASFVLGSINALQAAWPTLAPTPTPAPAPDALDPAAPDPAAPDPAAAPGADAARAKSVLTGVTASDGPLLVAISGGSYTAAGMGLVRAFPADPDGSMSPPGEPPARHDPPLRFVEAFAPDSPELKYLRRHTRDLFEPRAELVTGLIGLVAGAALNIVILLGILTAAAWAASWLATASGVLRLGPDGARLEVTNPLLVGDGASSAQWIGWVLYVLLGLILFGTLVLWQSRRERDDASQGEPPDSRRFAWARSLQAGAVVAALAWLVLMVALPTAVGGLSNAAADNFPSAAVGRALHQTGFTTPALCRQAAGESVLRAASAARVDALVSPGTKREYDAGACGFTASVAIQLVAPAGTCPSDGSVCPDRADERWKELGGDLIAAAGGSARSGTPSQIAGLTAILAAVGALLRAAGGSGASASSSGVLATVRRLVLGWLPPLVVFLVLTWFVLTRMFDTAVAGPSPTPSLDKIMLPLLALTCAAWQDANVTSMHTYYRHRLSNAFAVGRVGSRTDPTAGADTSVGAGGPAEAQALDEDRYYRFSDLGPVGLRVATTANVRAYQQTPTRRGGVPLTFDAKHVVLQAPGGTVDIGCYERAAGLGRTTVMAAVAISGAAVSPMAGRMSTRIGPFRLLLTLFNIRIGVWALNPLWVREEEASRSDDDPSRGHAHRPGPDGSTRGAPGLWKILQGWPSTPWLLRRPGTVQVVAEAFGASSMHDRWLYLSDGGHLDNTGMVEAVRALLPLPVVTPGAPDATARRRALVIDASNDAAGTWTAVGDALSVVSADLNVHLERVPDPVQSADSRAVTEQVQAAAPPAATSWWRRSDRTLTREFARRYRTPDGALEVLVVKAVRPADVPTSVLPDSVRAFALTHPDFPRAATTRQDFGDLEFEAYRMLGQVYTERALEQYWLPGEGDDKTGGRGFPTAPAHP